MKILYYTLILSIYLIASLQCSVRDGFKIVGQIDGIEDSTLIRLYDFDNQIDIDSAFSKNGTFILEGKVDYPKGFWIRCKDEYAIIQVENMIMNFSSPLTNMDKKSIIKGGTEQNLQNELGRLLSPYQVLYLEAFDSLWNKKYTNEQEKQELIKKYNLNDSLVRINNINFGLTHCNSFLGLDILYRNRMSISKDTLVQILNSLNTAFQISPNYKSIRIYLDENLVQVGKPFIDFTAKSITGEDFLLSSLTGKYIFLCFWSSDCAPCRIQNRYLSKNYSGLSENLKIVNFSLDKNPKLWQESSKADNICWQNLIADENEIGKVSTIYNVQAKPTSFLIDTNGIVIDKLIGFSNESNLIQYLNNHIQIKNNKR